MIRDDEIHYACVDDYDDDCVIMIVVNCDCGITMAIMMKISYMMMLMIRLIP